MTVYGRWNELYEILTADPASGVPMPELEYVTRVYRGYPRSGNMAKPLAVTVTLDNVGDVDVTYTVAIYASPDTDALLAQEHAMRTVDAIEELFNNYPAWERGQWTFGYVSEIDAFVTTLAATVGREDF